MMKLKNERTGETEKRIHVNVEIQVFFFMYHIEGYIGLTEIYRLLNISRAMLGSSWGVLSGC